MQSYDGAPDDFPLAYAHERNLPWPIDPDEVHRASIANLELARHLFLPREVEMAVTRGS